MSQELDPDVIEQIHQAWLDHSVLVFRGQKFSQDDQIRITGYFGELAPLTRPAKFRPPGYDRVHPNIMMISNIRENGETIGALPDGEMHFHHDQIHAEIPHAGTLLYSVEIPTHGGDTLFADGYAAYDTLDPALKAKLEGHRALNFYNYGSTMRGDTRGVGAIEPGGPSDIPHPRGDRPQGDLCRSADDAVDRGHVAGGQRRAAGSRVRSCREAGIRLPACLARRRPDRVGQSLLDARTRRFPLRPAPADAADHDAGDGTAVLNAVSAHAAEGERAARWHAEHTAEVLKQLSAGSDGLTGADIAKRQEVYGLNRLPAAKPRDAVARFLAQFHNLLIYVLLGAAAVAAVLGHGVDTAVILGVVLANAAIGFIQEGRAEKALDAIKNMITPQASVLRDGRRCTIGVEQVVPGDVVLIEAGDRVPADLRLIRARNLKIEEAILTGESMAVEKAVEPVDADAALGDRSSMAYSGTFVVAGQGRGVAIATGLGTELGRISAMLGAVETLTTPLVRQMNRFARQLTITILGISVAVFVFAVWFRSYGWAEAFMAMVGLAVAAIPEGLPAVMTITLAIGVQRMAARNAIIRHLPAVETLGSVSIICSDKTGTLTRNEMMVQTAVTAADIVDVTGTGYAPGGTFRQDGREIDVMASPVLTEFARAALLCNDATLRQTESGWMVDGDPMEGALVSFAIKAGLDADLTRKQFPRTDEIPFDSRHRFMATLHHGHESGAAAYVKGAPEQIIAMCSAQLGSDGPQPIDRSRWERSVDALGAKGQRVLALAKIEMPRGTRDLGFQDVRKDLTLLGLVGLIDPPREEAIAAVAECAPPASA